MHSAKVKSLQFARSVKIGLWKKLMWSHESKFTIFQSDGCIRVRKEVDEIMHLLWIVPTVQAYGGSVMIWGCFSLSGLGSATSFAQKNEVS